MLSEHVPIANAQLTIGAPGGRLDRWPIQRTNGGPAEGRFGAPGGRLDRWPIQRTNGGPAEGRFGAPGGRLDRWAINGRTEARPRADSGTGGRLDRWAIQRQASPAWNPNWFQVTAEPRR